tara:strand:- start:334 stop:903 length:570 start_codon:yes stop_codon:yes gene_type:complete
MNENDYNDFMNGLLDLIEKHQNDFEPEDFIFMGIEFFSKMSFDMAPDIDQARKTITAGIDSGLEESIKDLTEASESEWTTENIVWSIYSDSSFNNQSDWIEADEVGFTDDGTTWIAEIPDGEYQVEQPVFDGSFAVLENKVIVQDGKIDIDSCKVAVTEFLNDYEDWHYFIESVQFSDAKQTVSFFLGS